MERVYAPGHIHKMIASADGEWTEKILMWMDPTATTPSETVSTTTNEMILVVDINYPKQKEL